MENIFDNSVEKGGKVSIKVSSFFTANSTILKTIPPAGAISESCIANAFSLTLSETIPCFYLYAKQVFLKHRGN